MCKYIGLLYVNVKNNRNCVLTENNQFWKNLDFITGKKGKKCI